MTQSFNWDGSGVISNTGKPVTKYIIWNREVEVRQKVNSLEKSIADTYVQQIIEM